MALPDAGHRVGVRRVEEVEVRFDRVTVVDPELLRHPLIPDRHEREPADLPLLLDCDEPPVRIPDPNFPVYQFSL